MVYGVSKSPPVDESDLLSFIGTLSTLPVEEWQKRIAALKRLVDSIPDYSSTPLDNGNGAGEPMTPSSGGNGGKSLVPWYRSSKSVRRLALPLKMLLLDARSAVVKEATELIGTLMIVKLQPHPSLTMDVEGGGATRNGTNAASTENGGLLETISGHAKQVQQPPPPAFVGRLLFKDLLPSILDLSRQTVKLIRTYGVGMTLDILPHCRVKSCIVVLLERMKTHQNRTVKEDCARYLRCVLETWPWDPTGSCDNISNADIGIVNSRREERLSLDSTRQIGLGLGRTLSDSAKPVREEAKRGFQVLFTRFRPIWDEVMSSGVVRDVRLRKKLLEVASRSDGKQGKLFDDMASLGEMSLNSAVSGLSYASVRSNASHRSYRGGMASNGVPSVIGTPKVTPRSRARYSPSGGGSPGYMRGTGSSATRNAEQGKIQAKEASNTYATNQYVTSSGHVMSTPSPRKGNARSLYGGGDAVVQQPFASLLQTPSRHDSSHHHHNRPVLSKQKSSKVLRKRLSRRISGIKEEIPDHNPLQSPSQLCSINEAEDGNDATPPPTVGGEAISTEITNVALEVIAAHLAHLEEIEASISKERGILLDLNKQLGITISDATNAAELSDRLASLSEEQVCDYFELVHVCADKQRSASEELLREMERISQGDVSTVSALESPASRRDVPQSPLGGDHELSLQRNLGDEFGD